jgi:hypothetical protein
MSQARNPIGQFPSAIRLAVCSGSLELALEACDGSVRETREE